MAVSDLSRYYGTPETGWQWGGEAEKAARDVGLRRKRGSLVREEIPDEMYYVTATPAPPKRVDSRFPRPPGPDASDTEREMYEETVREINRGHPVGLIRNQPRQLPQRRDTFGNLITPESQFGGGPDPNVRRFYPNVSGVGGGYFMSYGRLAEELGHDPAEFTASGGFVGRRRGKGLDTIPAPYDQDMAILQALRILQGHVMKFFNSTGT